MPKSTSVVELRKRCFCSFKVGGVEVELFTEDLDGGAVRVRITSPKKIGELRSYQELPGFASVEPPASARTVPLKKAASA